jgi:hypothetical protein
MGKRSVIEGNVLEAEYRRDHIMVKKEGMRLFQRT